MFTRSHPLNAAVIFSTLLLVACGLKLGPTTINDPAPLGSILASTGFSSIQSEKTVSGLAEVYLVSSTNEYVVRLSSFSAPSGLNLEVLLVSNGLEAKSWTLRGTSGNQNYFTGIFAGSDPRTFEEVKIQNTNTTPTIYGLATFNH